MADLEKVAAIWREKLDFFQAELALAADPDRKFQLQKGIEEARTKIVELGGNLDAPRATSPARPPRLPRAPRCFGREREVEVLVAALCAEPPSPTALLGGPGMGKSTISLKALDDVRVIGKFGPRRYIVRCEAAETEEAVIRALASGVGLDLKPGGDLTERVFLELERAPAALVLDNLETPWWADPEPVEKLLTQLDGVPGLALAVSLRGGRRPLQVRWGKMIEVDVLPPEAARQTFVAIATKHQVGRPELDGLLEAVDRVALAVELLAHQAEDEPNLAALRRRWEALRTEMLQVHGSEHRSANFGASLELSVKNLRSPEAKQLLALLGVLPAGIAVEDISALVDDPDAAAAALRRVGLLDRRDDNRIHVLAPVREYVAKRLQPDPEQWARVIALYPELHGDMLWRESILPEQGEQIRLTLEEVNDLLIAALAKNPALMHEVHPRRFEELVAELFNRMGYEVTLTSPSRDRGRDVLAIRRDGVGTILTLVECKKFRPDRKVGVALVRSLYGVVSSERASHGVIATTSSFTRGAKSFQQDLQYQLSLRDFNDLAEWCHRHRRHQLGSKL